MVHVPLGAGLMELKAGVSLLDTDYVSHGAPGGEDPRPLPNDRAATKLI